MARMDGLNGWSTFSAIPHVVLMQGRLEMLLRVLATCRPVCWSFLLSDVLCVMSCCFSLHMKLKRL